MFFDEYLNKVFSWWLSWILLCGVLACIISGFVTANRYGFSAYGVQCAYERIYYDLEYGQLKKSYPKWEGFEGLSNTKKHLENIYNTNKNKINNSLNSFYMDYLSYKKIIEKRNDTWKENLFYPIPIKLAEAIGLIIEKNNYTDDEGIKEEIKKIENNIYIKLNNFIQLKKYSELMQENQTLKEEDKNFLQDLDKNFSSYRTQFIKDFKHYTKIARAMGRIIPMIFFSLLLIFVVGSGALLITYYCKKVNQQWWILPMHIAWNGLRFFIFLFFIYGCAYGMFYKYCTDLIAYFQYAFSKENIEDENPIIIPKNATNMLKYCLFYDTNIFEDKLGNILLDKFLYYLFKYEKIKDPEFPKVTKLYEVDEVFKNVINNLNKDYTYIYYSQFNKDDINYFKPMFEQTGTIYGNFNCSFVNNTIHLMYRAIWDFSWETRILCALSCCIAFFGIIAVYSFLWSMHLWKKEDNYYNSENNNNKKSKNFNFNKNKTLKKKFIPAPKDNVSENNSEFKNDDNDDDENS